VYRLPAIAAILFYWIEINCCPTADLSDIRPSHRSGVFDWCAVDYAPDELVQVDVTARIYRFDGVDDADTVLPGTILVA